MTKRKRRPPETCPFCGKPVRTSARAPSFIRYHQGGSLGPLVYAHFACLTKARTVKEGKRKP